MSLVARIPRLIPQKTAFFVCDMQERFRSAIHAFKEVSDTSAKMVKAARILEIPVIATEQNPKALGSTISELDLAPLPAPINPLGSPLAKTKFSMWLPEVEAALKKHEITSVVLFGIESHICVLQTSLDLLEHDYNVYVIADGVSSCNPGERKVAFERLRQAGAQVTTSESVLYELLNDASHPSFKAIAGLVKETKETTKAATAALLQ